MDQVVMNFRSEIETYRLIIATYNMMPPEAFERDSEQYRNQVNRQREAGTLCLNGLFRDIGRQFVSLDDAKRALHALDPKAVLVIDGRVVGR